MTMKRNVQTVLAKPVVSHEVSSSLGEEVEASFKDLHKAKKEVAADAKKDADAKEEDDEDDRALPPRKRLRTAAKTKELLTTAPTMTYKRMISTSRAQDRCQLMLVHHVQGLRATIQEQAATIKEQARTQAVTVKELNSWRSSAGEPLFPIGSFLPECLPRAGRALRHAPGEIAHQLGIAQPRDGPAIIACLKCGAYMQMGVPKSVARFCTKPLCSGPRRGGGSRQSLYRIAQGMHPHTGVNQFIGPVRRLDEQRRSRRGSARSGVAAPEPVQVAVDMSSCPKHVAHSASDIARL